MNYDRYAHDDERGNNRIQRVKTQKKQRAKAVKKAHRRRDNAHNSRLPYKRDRAG